MQAKPRRHKSTVMGTIPGALRPPRWALQQCRSGNRAASVLTSSKASLLALFSVADGSWSLLMFAAGSSPAGRCHGPSSGGSGTKELAELSHVVLLASFPV